MESVQGNHSSADLPLAGWRDAIQEVDISLGNPKFRGILLATVMFYLFCKYTYRIYFHKLSGIPGPVWNAATHLHEAYHNIIGDGYAFQYMQLHKDYNSPVIRIGTDHVHVGDSQYYHTIYNSGTDFPKAGVFYKKLGIDGSILTIADPAEHKEYRGIVVPLFSKKVADGLAPFVVSHINKAADSMAKQGRAGEKTIIHQVYRTLTGDIACKVVFDRPMGLLDTPGVEADHYHPFFKSVDNFTGITWPRIYYRIVNWAISNLPAFVVDMIQPGMPGYAKMFAGWLDRAISDHDSGIDPTSSASSSSSSSSSDSEGGVGGDAYTATRKGLYDLVVEARRKSDTPVDAVQLFDDTWNYIIAGMEATTYVMSFATWYLLRDADVLGKLEAELSAHRDIIQGEERFDHRKVMALPYLSAVVKESLRLSNTVPGVLPRIVPRGGVQIGEYHVPEGVMISMVHPVVERDESIFPDSESFVPERWLGPDAGKLDKWMIAFSKGRRQCIGQNAAHLQLYALIAIFFGRFKMELFETTEEDVQIVDQFAPILKKPVKVKILEDRWAKAE